MFYCQYQLLTYDWIVFIGYILTSIAWLLILFETLNYINIIFAHEQLKDVIWLSLIILFFFAYHIICQYVNTKTINVFYNIRSINSPIKMRWIINILRADQYSISL